MRIVVTGTRGIPGIQGGVETHCEALFPRIVDAEHEVIIVRRPQFKSPGYDASYYKGVQVKDVKTLSGKYFEAFAHTVQAVCYARRVHADIVHIHAIGPALITPLVKLLGMKAVVTHHGPDYDRQKWGNTSKKILRLGERLGARYADKMIVISKHIEKMMFEKYAFLKEVELIHNGVDLQLSDGNDVLQKYDLQDCKYILAVGRFVEEKGFDLLIKAHAQSQYSNAKLVIAGDADHADQYSEGLKRMARQHDVVLTGFLQKEQLVQLYSNAALFVLPSFHEGLPISLLEAMWCKCDVLVSDIPANLEVDLSQQDYFKCGNVDDLTLHLNEKMMTNNCNKRLYDMRKYDWDYIAAQTKEVYDSLLKK